MNYLETDHWWRARTLAERAADGADGGASGSRRLERWRADFPDEEVLAARLAIADLDVPGLARVLGAADRAPATAGPPDWWRWVIGAFEAHRGSATVTDGDAVDGDLVRGCVRLVIPLAKAAREEIRARCLTLCGYGEIPVDIQGAARLLAPSIAVELGALASAAVALEMQAARAAGALAGATPTERAARFLRELATPEQTLRFFAENPALTRALHDRAQLRVEAGVELLWRLAADWTRLCRELLDRPPGPLTAIEPLGDSHDGGRRVMRLDFAGGARIVYKPRSIAADLAWRELLDWLTDAGFGLRFRTARCVPGGDDHLWQEWIEAAACGDSAELVRYYRRLGGQLALLHALQAIDTHQDNVLACAEHPVMVDLECLLHPRLGATAAERVDPLIAETGPGCVLRVGLLPRADVAFGIDVSGLGRDPVAAVSVEETVWLDEGTDEVRMGRKTMEARAGLNAPRLGERLVRPHEHVSALVEGFQEAHRLLRRDRDALLAPGGPIAAFSGVTVRIILRPTRTYAALLARQAADPAAPADGLAREEALNALWRGARRRPDLLVAAPAEYHDLSRGDIPRITTRPGSDAGHHHRMGIVEDLLGPHRAPLPDCLRGLDQADCDRQIAFLRASVIAAAGNLPEPGHRLPGRNDPPREGEFESVAHALARRLELVALRDGPAAGWLTAVAAPGHAGQVLRPLEPGLAEGQAGVAVFLAAFARAADDDRARDLARSSTRHLCALIDRSTCSVRRGSDGPATEGGVVWALVRLASWLEDPDLLERALELAKGASSVLGQADVDCAEIVAWAIGLTSLASTLPDARVRSMAGDCAARLLSAPAQSSSGLLSGRGGHGLALTRLGELLDEDDLLRAAATILEIRTEDGDGSLATGTAGRAVSLATLLRSGRCPRPPEIEAELRREVDTTVSGAFGRNHSLGFGDLGTLVALAEAADALADPLLAHRARCVSGAVLASVGELGPRCAGPAAVEVPGLLSGLAGIGFGWLRLWALESGCPQSQAAVEDDD